MGKIKTLAIIQSRANSTRLPGKVTKKIQGKSLIELMVERVRRAKKLDMIVLATSTSTSDDIIKQICDDISLPCFRGNLNNVLDRFYQAALLYQPNTVIRLTGDCPLIDPDLIDKMIDLFYISDCDYLSNTIKPTFPDGLDCEIMNFYSLQNAHNNAKLQSEIEHVTPYINKHPEIYKLENFENNIDLNNLRWTVDEPEDFVFVKKVYEALYPEKTNFNMTDILDLLEKQPALKNINNSFIRNEGFQKSLNADKQWKNRIVKSLEYQKRAIESIPGLCQLLSKRPDMFSKGVWPGYFSKAKGAYVWDIDRNKYLDMSIGGIGANVLGYCDKDINDAVISAVNNCNSTSLNCPEEVELAELLCNLHPWSKKVRFSKTGGECMSIAIRIARAHTGKDKVVFCGYHGWHDWYLAANLGAKNALGDHLISGLEPSGVPKSLKETAIPFSFNRIDQFNEAVNKADSNLAAVVLEPIRDEEPSADFVNSIQQFCNRTNTILIVDEISSGFRMNCGGSHLLFNIEPDIAVFSKALGNGYPIGAIIGKNEVMEAAQKTFISSTYWTERVGFAAALATINKFKTNKVHNHLMELGKKVQEGWKIISTKYSIDINIGGIYPLSHFSFYHQNAQSLKAFFIQEMLKKGILASNICYIMFSHSLENIHEYLNAVDTVFSMIREKLDNGTLESSLEGEPSQVGFKRLN